MGDVASFAGTDPGIGVAGQRMRTALRDVLLSEGFRPPETATFTWSSVDVYDR